jgi:hypothetical protein
MNFNFRITHFSKTKKQTSKNNNYKETNFLCVFDKTMQAKIMIYKAPHPGLCFAPAATWNLHTTQPRTLLPTYDKVVNLTGLL